MPRAMSPMETPSCLASRIRVLITPGDSLQARAERGHPLHVLAVEGDSAQALEGVLGDSHGAIVPPGKLFDNSIPLSIMK